MQGNIDEFKPNPNNNTAHCLSGSNNTELDSNSGATGWDNGTCTISTGDYYLTKFVMDKNGKENLVFNTSGGDVNIAVDMPADDITWKQANISVTGPGNVTIYLNGGIVAGSGGPNVKINRYGNTNDTSSRFQIFSSSGSVTPPRPINFIKGGTEFCGFVYAPYAQISVEQGTTILGALVGNKFTIINAQNIHYDEALQNLHNDDLDSGATIMYLHITRNDIGAGIS